MALRRIQHYLQEMGKEVIIDHHRSCDIHPGCQEVLTSSTQAARHVFADILDRLPQEWRQRVDDLLQPASEVADSNSRQAREAESYKAIGKLIRENRHQIFSLQNTAECLRHEQACPVHAPPSVGVGHDPRRRLRLHVAGPSCTAWSSMGLRRGLADKTSIAWNVWLNERAEIQEEIIVVENSPNLSPSLLADELSASHFLVWANLSPEDVGWPAARPRLYLAALKRTTFAWGGAESQEGNVREEFMKQYGRTVELTGDAFLIDSEDQRRQEMSEKWGRRRAASSTSLSEGLSPADLPIEEHTSPCKARRGSHPPLSLESLHGQFSRLEVLQSGVETYMKEGPSSPLTSYFAKNLCTQYV